MPSDSSLDQEYIQWQKIHVTMKDSPPQDGRDYLKHAKILLVLLEGASEVHPFAKSVITSFKTIVMFEQDRRENDARVTAVFLAQTDMMRVLLDVDDISSRRHDRQEAEHLRSSATLGNLLLSAQKEIKSCGNSIDTYYKESRFVKFWKAQDWKERILGHVNQFDKFRLQLQQILSLQVASGVQDLVSKMDVVLSRLYTPSYEWEKDLDMKTRSMGPLNSWIQNTTTLQSLIFITKDPLVPLPSPGEATDLSATLTTSMLISKVQKDLEQSLDALCKKNIDMFELKINFHTDQMEKAIVNSAHFVVQSLSGPSDRLAHEDLRQLWKEMGWLFCIENKVFGSALFEFYLDRFSTSRRQGSHPKEGTGAANSKKEEIREVQDLCLPALRDIPAPKFTFMSRLGFINHPDSWTLEYISRHGDKITQTIDDDNSGFIRISEANAFTGKMPKGWSLPQWCAYSSAGWAYEDRIYRRRIQNITSIITEMQPHVLDSNRTYLVVFSLIIYLTTSHAFSREPIDQDIPALTPELRQLVREKVLEQDNLCRGHLQSLRWTLEDESTIHLLYGEIDPEKYILQLCTLLLEQLLALVYICRKVTVDIGEWMRLTTAFRVMRGICVNRIFELEERYKEHSQGGKVVAAYRGGVWSYFVKIINRDAPLTSNTFIPCSRKELDRSLADASILNDFPVSPETATTLAYLQYQTWEEHFKPSADSEIPLVIPRSWNSLDENLPKDRLSRVSVFSSFPFTGSKCDVCGKLFEGKPRYNCMDSKCFDFDMCQNCYRAAEKEPKGTTAHEFGHHVIYVCLMYMPDQQQRIGLEIDDILEQLQQQYSAQQRSRAFINVGTLQEENEAIPKPEDNPVHDTTDAQRPHDDDGTLQQAQVQDVGLSEKGASPLENGARNSEEEKPRISDVLVTQNRSSSSYTQFRCGRCNDPISLENDFYRCVGHVCQDYFVCENCVLGERFEADDNEHQWWHTLLCLRNDMITGSQSLETVPVVDVAQKETEVAQIPRPSTTMEARIARIGEVLDSMHMNHSSVETMRVANERLEGNVGRLEERVGRLEDKIDDMMLAIRQLLNGKLVGSGELLSNN